MRITIVSPYPVYPPKFGGQSRIWGLARGYVAAGHNVKVICNYTYQFNDAQEGVIDGVRIKFVRTYFQDLVAFAYSKKILPLIFSYPFNKLVGRFYKSLLNDCDLIIFEQPFLAGWMDYVASDVPCIYSAQNVESDYELVNFPKNRLASLFKPLLLKCEKEAIEKATAMFSCSEEDIEIFRKKYGVKKNIILVENGFEKIIVYRKKKDELRARNGFASTQKIALFIGSHSPPNVEAATFILKELAPQLPEWTFVIVGEVEGFLTKERVPANVSIVGEVDDLTEWLLMADVGLLPLSYGSGSSLKLLEYLRSGLPVISTTVGLRGYRRLRRYIPPASLGDFVVLLAKGKFFKVPRREIEGYTWRSLAEKSLLKLKLLGVIK